MGKESTKQSEAQSAEVLPLKKSSVIPVGGDDGHYGIKLVIEGATPGELIQIYVPSRVAEGAVVSMSDGNDDNVYEADGATYTVSETLPPMETRFADYALSGLNRVLVHHALIKAGLGGKQVRLVTGLPVSDYFLADKPNTDFIERKVKSLLSGTVANKNDGVALAEIVQHAVKSEAITAFYDQLIANDGTINGDFATLAKEAAIAYIDIGGKTTDSVVIVNAGKSFDARRSGTSPIGALDLNGAVTSKLKQQFKVDQLSPAQVEKAILTGSLRMYAKEHDCSEIINAEKRVLAEKIRAEAHRKMGEQAADIEAIYFVGGGAALLQEQLQDLYPHAVFVKDPQFANARGMFKIAKYMMTGA